LSKSELSKDSAAAASPKSTGSLAPCSEPVPWCKTTLESDFQYTRTQGCLRGGYALYVKDDNGDVIGVGNVKIVQEIKLEPNSEQFTTWTEGDQHTAGRTDTYSWNKVAGGLQRRPGRTRSVTTPVDGGVTGGAAYQEPVAERSGARRRQRRSPLTNSCRCVALHPAYWPTAHSAWSIRVPVARLSVERSGMAEVVVTEMVTALRPSELTAGRV
jgi:hypothetical protein